MASTITIQQSANWASSFGGFKLLNIGNSLEPAITSANIIIQTILSAPFCWNWNRASTTFNTVIGQQDYAISVPTFGFIEKADYTRSGATSEIVNTIGILGSGSEQGTPNNITAQIDNNAGTITFRLLPVPDQVYNVNVIFQKRIPSLISSMSNTWTPIPDHFSLIYQYGFLSLMMAYLDDPRWTLMTQKFVASLLAVAEGLSEEQRDAFEQAWLLYITEQSTTGLRRQQGVQASGL